MLSRHCSARAPCRHLQHRQHLQHQHLQHPLAPSAPLASHYQSVLTRFAPAPTGWLHLGHVLNAELVWGAAARARVASCLRIEDHDRTRCRPEYEAGILDDLDWLGSRAGHLSDERVSPAGAATGRQSDRDALYQRGRRRASRPGLVYGCDCTRRRDRQPIPRSISRSSATTDGAATAAVALSDEVGWRVRMDPGVEHFVDERLGPQAQDPSAQCGDVLIRDRHGNWTYQLCVAVDDSDRASISSCAEMDLLPSTGRQIRLARLLGRSAPPAFHHHPLIMKSRRRS